MMQIAQVKKIVLRHGKKLGLGENSWLYPIFGEMSACISEGVLICVDQSAYHYVSRERGQIREHYSSANLDDLLYRVFSSITFELASDYELEHRKKDEDSRRQIWAKQLELLRRIHPQFVDRCRAEIEYYLSIAPFRDHFDGD